MSRVLSPYLVKVSSDMIEYVLVKRSIIDEEARKIAINPRDLELQVFFICLV